MPMTFEEFIDLLLAWKYSSGGSGYTINDVKAALAELLCAEREAEREEVQT